MAILWMATAAVFGAAGQILFKQATETRTGFISILLSPHALAPLTSEWRNDRAGWSSCADMARERIARLG
jgi:hypothetical protein